MTVFMTFLLAAIGTYGLRIMMIVGEKRFAGVEWLQSHVSLVSPAVLAAVVASAVVVSNGAVVMPDLVVLSAVAAGMYAVRRSGNVVAALVVGLPVYWLAVGVGLV